MTSFSAPAQAARYLGAAALLGVGVDHLWEYHYGFYSALPTIGSLFLANFAAALVIAAGLVVPWPRLSRRGARLTAALAVCGTAVALGSLAALAVSETSGLFGFMEYGYRTGIVVAIVLEATTALLLATFLVLAWSSPSPRRRSTMGTGRGV
jgi:hypothetical protein